MYVLSFSSKSGNVTFKLAENNHKTIHLKDALSLELNSLHVHSLMIKIIKTAVQ